jgi:hypothetical protein
MKIAGVVMLSFCIASASGCCGLFLPAKDDVIRWKLSGRSADDAVEVLRSKGFNIELRDASNIAARRAIACLLVEDFLWIYLALDASGRVASTKVDTGRIPP